jgi:hypothetical protein
MKLEQQVVSLELAKKLKELGVKQESLFYWLWQNLDETESNLSEWLLGSEQELASFPKTDQEYSAFTVAELGEMLPRIITPTTHIMDTGKTHDDKWYITYRDQLKYKNTLLVQEAETEANARAKMLIYLVQQNLLVLVEAPGLTDAPPHRE